MRPILGLLLVVVASAVETKPVPVLRVIDGITIEVGADLGGAQVPVRVRLAYMARLPNTLRPGLVRNPDGSTGVENFVVSGERAGADKMPSILLAGLRKDADGLGAIQLVLPPTETSLDEGLPAIVLIRKEAFADPNAEDFTIQEMCIGSGLAVYSRTDGDAPDPWHEKILSAQATAKDQNRGLWKSEPEAMAALAKEHAVRKVKR